jgi:ABC-type Fe3+/spermidine/putrescine transport system ATPase subunit
VGPAAEIYAAPRSLFVARFVGESNVLAGRTVAAEGELAAAEVPSLGLLRGRAAAGLSPGQEARLVLRPQLLGLHRPEDAPSPGEGVGRLAAEIEQVLFLGHRTEIHLRAGPERLVVWQHEAPAAWLRPGQPALVEWRLRDLLLFPAEA